MRKIFSIALFAFLAYGPAALATQDTQKNTSSGVEQKTMTLDQVILEEYKALREEINLCAQNRVNIVSMGFAALGALLAGGLGALAGKKQHWLVSGIIIGVGMTIMNFYILSLWTEESKRLARASYHNCYLEAKINRLFSGEVLPLEWEHKIRTDAYKSFSPSDKGGPWIFLVILVFSAAGGTGLFLKGAKDHEKLGWVYKYRELSMVLAFTLSFSLVVLFLVDLHRLKNLWGACPG